MVVRMLVLATLVHADRATLPTDHLGQTWSIKTHGRGALMKGPVRAQPKQMIVRWLSSSQVTKPDITPVIISTTFVVPAREGRPNGKLHTWRSWLKPHRLNAIMLGRLRMTADQCLANYPSMARNIFGNPRPSISGFPKDKFKAKVLEIEIKKIMETRTGRVESAQDEAHYFPAPEDLCRT